MTFAGTSPALVLVTLSAMFVSQACGSSSDRATNTISSATGGLAATTTGGSSASPGGRSSGGSSATGGSSVSLIPPDTRPTAPAWQPAISLGSNGWLQSTTSYCDTHQGAESGRGVWADSRGIFASLTTRCTAAVDVINCTGTEGWGLQFNDGIGWSWQYSATLGVAPSLAGFPNGPLILLRLGAPGANADSSVSFFDSGALKSQTDLGNGSADAVAGAFGVSPSHAYFTVNTYEADPNGKTLVVEYLDGTWSTIATLPFVGAGVWADATNVVVAGPNQAMYQQKGSGSPFVPLPNVPAGNYSTLWGFASNDFWVGNGAGQLLHYDGSQWQTVTTGCSNVITGLWGAADGVLYFTTPSEFGRISSMTAEMLIPSTANLHIRGLWGLSSQQVFLAVDDSSFAGYKCGGSFLVWYDGAVFHQF